MSLIVNEYEWRMDRLAQENQRDRKVRKLAGADWVQPVNERLGGIHKHRMNGKAGK